MAPRRVTVSTSGVVPKIRPLLELVPINLAVSLHATTDAVRDVLVPLNRRFPLAELLGTLRRAPGSPRGARSSSSTPDGGRERLAGGRAAAGAAARRNPVEGEPDPDEPARGFRSRPPPSDAVETLHGGAGPGGNPRHLRRSRGRDIDAACGQLAAREPAAERLDQAGVQSADDLGGVAGKRCSTR